MGIPKTIHYCWFGCNPKPELAKKCIASWKKYCPDYEIIEWNEENFDISSAPLYVRQAYEAKKWAFVSDYVRLYVMTLYGGIYMDTDMELIKPIDAFLERQAFSGFEDDSHIAAGIMGCEKGFSMIKELLHYYDNILFCNEDGSLNQTTIVITITNACKKRNYNPNGRYQVVGGFALYPCEVFYPLNNQTGMLRKTKSTVAIHWYSGSWVDDDLRQYMEDVRKSNRAWQRKDFFLHLPNRIMRKVLGTEHYEWLKKKIKGH